jgi:pyruvate formate lyase activating enzyme
MQKLTLLDFPGKVACTVFTLGCNFRCGFCHNAPLVLTADTPHYEEEEFFRFLETRKGLLDGVAVTGGEPLLQPELPQFLEKIKALGYGVKLDSNGSYPKQLKQLLQNGLIDYVAMDIKNSPEKYELTAGAKGILPAVEESVRLLMEGTVPYEFRTTVVREHHEEADFHAIGQWLKGAQAYYIQCFVDSGNILQDGLHAPTQAELEKYLAIAKEYIVNTHLRGV